MTDGGKRHQFRVPEHKEERVEAMCDREGGAGPLLVLLAEIDGDTTPYRDDMTLTDWLRDQRDLFLDIAASPDPEPDQAAQECEQDAARLLADTEARLRQAEAQTAALEERARRIGPAVQAADALLRAGWKQADMAAGLRALSATKLNAEAVAGEIERLGNIGQVAVAWSEHVRKLQADATRLQGEVATLQEERAKLLGAVRDAVKDATGAAADEVRESLTAIRQTAAQMRAANGHASVQLAKAARFLRDQRAKLADRDKMAAEALASLVRTVGPVALAAELLALYIADAGDPELPRALAETMPYSPRLSWAEGKLRSLAAQVAPQVIATGEAPAANEGREGA